MNKITVPKTLKMLSLLILAAFFAINPVYAQRAPINVNIIIDGSSSLNAVRDEVTTWVSSRLDEILINGDTVTVWNAASTARVIYTGRIEGETREIIKRNIRDLSPSGNNPDFSGALRDATSRSQNVQTYSYTLLISASPQALSSVISNPQGNLLRFSRIEEFSAWRALVVGLNIDTTVKTAASAYFNN